MERHVKFSLVSIGILIFNAVESMENNSFKHLHREDHDSVKYKKKYVLSVKKKSHKVIF